MYFQEICDALFLWIAHPVKQFQIETVSSVNYSNHFLNIYIGLCWGWSRLLASGETDWDSNMILTYNSTKYPMKGRIPENDVHVWSAIVTLDALINRSWKWQPFFLEMSYVLYCGMRPPNANRGKESVRRSGRGASEFEIIAINHRWILKLSDINMYEIDCYVWYVCADVISLQIPSILPRLEKRDFAYPTKQSRSWQYSEERIAIVIFHAQIKISPHSSITFAGNEP
jgi:hypothetical protein